VAVSQSTQSFWDVIVPIKKEGILTPLFFLHAIGGNVLNYSALIPYLDKRQPVYGVQAKGLDGISKPFQNLHEMLAHYVQQIQTVQAHGPYLLAGASMGGNLALEVAHLLQEKGEDILFLGMFDTKGPEDYFQTEQKSTNVETNNLPHPGILSWITDQWPNNRASSILAHAANLSMYFIYKIIHKPRPDVLRQWVMVYSNLKTMRNYNPKPYNGKITLFRSSYSRNEKPYYGWENISKKGIDIIEIPAHHGNFVESAELGKELNSYLSGLQQTH
jgi:thioesterase domain-containing protein